MYFLMKLHRGYYSFDHYIYGVLYKIRSGINHKLLHFSNFYRVFGTRECLESIRHVFFIQVALVKWSKTVVAAVRSPPIKNCSSGGTLSTNQTQL